MHAKIRSIRSIEKLAVIINLGVNVEHFQKMAKVKKFSFEVYFHPVKNIFLNRVPLIIIYLNHNY